MTDTQCEACGRVAWTPDSKLTTEAGSKARQGVSEVGEYRAWRWEWGGGAYVTDVDQVEWRSDNGVMRPAAVLELTCVRGGGEVPDSYFEAIRVRFERDFQGEAAKHVAESLGCEAYIVVWRKDLTEFWLYNLTRDFGWQQMDSERYRRWLTDKRGRATPCE